LALKLHDAITGGDDPFWLEYGALLPKAETMGQPMLKRGAELEALGPELAGPARQQQFRLRECMQGGHGLPPGILPALDAPDSEWPGTLPWAWALVRSRAFSAEGVEVKFADGTSGMTGRFAFVPFIDMANHGVNPNAAHEVTEDAVELRAVRKMYVGDTITISYGDMDQNQHYALYGFRKPEGSTESVPGDLR
jgi:hypothetical protein